MATLIYVAGFGLILAAPLMPGNWLPVLGMFVLFIGWIWHTLEQGPGRGNRNDT